MAQVKQPKFHNHFLVSLVLHVIILTVLIVSFEFNATNFVIENSDSPEVVKAVIIDASKFQVANPTPVTPAKVREEQPKKPVPPKPIIQKAPEPQVQQKTIAIPNVFKKQKEVIEKQLLADLKKQTEVNKKAKLKSKQKELEKAFEKELQEHTAKSLQQQLQSEKNRLASAKAQKMSGIVDKYKALILQAIAEHWLVPGGVNKKLSSELLIRVGTGGVVLDVRLVKSSGDDALDRSARTAVFKASPLPIPSDQDEFELFREFILKVKPENVTMREGGLG